MSARGDWLIFTRESAPAGATAAVAETVTGWLSRHGVAEVALEPLDGYYAIHINDDPKPVPGVFLPASLQDDAAAVEEILEAAYSVW